MAQSQKKKKSDKKKKPHNKAYLLRVEHPMRVLRNVIRSNGWNEAKAYAEKYGLTKELNRLTAASNWARRKMSGRLESQRPVRMRVGRSFRRGILHAQQANGKAYLVNPEVREATYIEALAMDAQIGPKIVAPLSKPKAKRKVSVKRTVKTKAKAKVAKRRK